MSYSKVRAVTRFATADDEAEVVAIAECATAAQMEALQAGMRRARTGEDVRRRHAARHFAYHYHDDGSLVGSFRLPPEQAAAFLHGLDAARGRLRALTVEGDDVSAETPGPPETTAASAADALVAMADGVVKNASAEASGDVAERFQLVLHSSAEALAVNDDAVDDGAGTALADGTRLHPSTARRLTCNCPTSTLIEASDGSPLHIGRRHRRVRGRLLRAVHARDRGRCRAPGCTERATQIHHIRHWANGGPTCLPNLISLCDQHHWLVHEGGFTILTRGPGEWALLSPAGVTIDGTPTPTPPAEPLPSGQTLRDDAVSGTWDGSRLDVDYVTSLLSDEADRTTTPAPAAAPGMPRSASTETFDAETLNAFAERMQEMKRRAVATGVVFHPDEPDEPYTW